MKNLTDWYSKEVNPVRVGVYHVDTFVGVRQSWWDGKEWGYFTSRGSEAAARLRNECKYPAGAFRWRGLLGQSKATVSP